MAAIITVSLLKMSWIFVLFGAMCTMAYLSERDLKYNGEGNG